MALAVHDGGHAGIILSASASTNREVESVDWYHPAAVQLRDAQQIEIAVRYGGPGAEVLDQGAFTDVDSIVATILVWAHGRAVAVGSVRDLTGVSDGVGGIQPDRTGEIKRMYVDPAVRGRGLSRLVMHELEERASAAGIERLVLESGTMQPEAIGLYLSLGYAPIEPYGAFATEPESRCFAKALADGAASVAAGAPASTANPSPAATTIRIRTVSWDLPEAIALRRENFERSTAVLYPEARSIGFERLDALAGEGAVAVFLAEVVPEFGSGGVASGPVGTAALTQFLARDTDAEGVGELRKLYVRPDARRRGVGRALLDAAEDLARLRGMRRMVMEVGIRQPAAVQLYTVAGYRPIRPYPPYDANAVALCFAKELALASAPRTAAV